MKILDVPQSGSVAGVTSSRNRFGQYRRSRAVPVQPRTPKQTSIRAAFTSAASLWRTLSDPQRTAWNDYAAQIVRNDSLGSSYSPTGAALFTGSSALDPISNISAPPTILPSWYLYVTGITYTDPTPGPEALEVAINTTDANNKVIIETSGPVSPGVTSAAAVRQWRSLPASALNLSANQFSMAANPIPMLSQYTSLFPSPSSGQTIWFRFNEVFFESGSNAGIKTRAAQTFRLIVP